MRRPRREAAALRRHGRSARNPCRRRRRGVIETAQRDTLADAMKRLHFSDRSFARLGGIAADLLPSACAAAFADWLPGNRVSQKGRDAEALLRFIAAGEADRLGPAPDFHMERALVWERFANGHDPEPPSRQERWVLEELALHPRARRRVARVALGRSAALRATAESADAVAALDTFRRERGLLSRAAVDEWLATSEVDAREFRALLEREAQLESARRRAEGPGLERMMLDVLRLDGQYGALRARAELERSNVGAVQTGSAVMRQLALDWFLGDHPELARHPIDTLAAELGFTDKNSLFDAVWLAYLSAQKAMAGNA